MNNRILMMVATATLISLSSGCSGMRNFLFGRGARCGLCSQRTPIFPRLRPDANVPAPVAAPGVCGNTYAPNYATEPGCGYERGCGYEAGCGQEIASNQCECGGVVSGYAPSNAYGPVVSDPYMSGNVIGDYPIDGQVIGGYPTGGTVIGGGVVTGDNFVPAPVDSQGYRANKVDTDGARILSEEPLPPGVTPLVQ